ncbi:hypothetical protein DYB36_004675 [Aphanomyces astaci]|uniref:DDE Tnp4 domain-containing protein n=1 Tax=Aphanomyces astaci TaxID=112090 RepID=A0A397B774_APHAT|nr:hypothetical protein DYB36_004675 [Aphanomyces astaci]
MDPIPPPASAAPAQPASHGLNATAVDHAVDVLTSLRERRDSKRQRYSVVARQEDDDDDEAPAPIMDLLIQTRGPTVVHELTNFSPAEFNMLWLDIQPYVNVNWNVGSGRKCQVTGRDMLFMALTSLKHCGSWDVVAAVFKEKPPTFSTRVTGFLTILLPHLKTKYIESVANKYSMDYLTKTGRRFKHFPMAHYAVDVTFQQTNAPAVSFGEKKVFFSKKHGQYGVKVEVSVLPNGLALNVTSAVPGSVSDITICDSNSDFHLEHLQKAGNDGEAVDAGPLSGEYPDSWALLADKGYQGLHRRLRAITPMKRPAGGLLSLEDMTNNDKIASDRVVVENFFGRLKTLWAVASETYTWKRENYDLFFQACVAFTNVHIKFLPLRDEDGHNLNRYVNRMLSSGEKKRAAVPVV